MENIDLHKISKMLIYIDVREVSIMRHI